VHITRGRSLGAALAVILVCGVVAGCDGSGPPYAAALRVRNVSSEPVTFEFDTPGTGLLGFAGVDRHTLVLDPWQPGWCPAADFGLPTGTMTITLAGPQIQGTPSHSWVITSDPQAPPRELDIVVDADGAVTFDAPISPNASPCLDPPLRTPTP